MKTKLLAVKFLLACFGINVTTSDGAEFQNLDFESAELPILEPNQTGGYQPVAFALPGWNAYLGTQLQDEVLYNTASFGSSTINIIGPNTSFGRVIEGNFSALLLAALDPQDGLTPLNVTIEQAGIVPSGMQSLQFKGIFPTPNPEFSFEPFIVTLNGQPIPMESIQNNGTYRLVAGNVSSFAGLDAELRITALAYSSGPNALLLDSIVFSPLPIPEPPPWAMWVLGSLLLGCKITRRLR